MNFAIKYFDTITASLVNWFSGNNSAITDMTVGSSIRTMFEAVGVELEGIYYQLYTGIVNGIQNGVYASFNFPLLQPQPASGGVVFSNTSPAPGGGTTIPAGTQISTAGVGGAAPVTYQTTDAVVMLAGTSSIAAVVVAMTSGSAGNAIAGAVNVMVGSPAGVSAVTNPVSFFTGRDLETSDARQTRFQNYIANLSRSTLGAITNAASQVPTVVAAVAFESPILKVQYFSQLSGYTDISFEANLPGGGPLSALNPVIEANDALYIGGPSLFSLLRIDLDKVMIGGVFVWEYFNFASQAWTTLPVSSDSTNFLSKSGYLYFTPPTDWAACTVSGVNKFYVRMRVIAPTASQVATVVQIAAQPFPGVIFLVAMDATATLPPSLQAQVLNAIQDYRGAGKQVFVTGPIITSLALSINVEAQLTADPVALRATISQAIMNFMSQFTLGQEFIVSKMVQYLRNQSTDILDIQILAPTANRSAAFNQIFQAGTITVNVSQ